LSSVAAAVVHRLSDVLRTKCVHTSIASTDIRITNEQ
jgi:hypothetical protein